MVSITEYVCLYKLWNRNGYVYLIFKKNNVKGKKYFVENLWIINRIWLKTDRIKNRIIKNKFIDKAISENHELLFEICFCVLNNSFKCTKELFFQTENFQEKTFLNLISVQINWFVTAFHLNFSSI